MAMSMLLSFLLPGIAIAWILTGAIRHYSVRYHWLDIPNDRSSHTIPKPRGGGLAIAITFCIGLIALYIIEKIELRVLLAFLGAGGMVATIGYLDDRAHVSPLWRLLFHIIAAIWSLICIGAAPSISVFDCAVWSGFVYIIAAIILVWVLNLYNFMDGIDGIAGSETIFIACSGILFTSFTGEIDMQLVAMLLVGATAGFLIWNWPPAKIFMGDVGSGFLGITLGIYAYWTILENAMSFWSWAIIFGIFIVDTTFTLFRRIIQREAWYEAHRSHAYQHAAKKWGHARVTLAVNLINLLWLLPIAYLSHVQRDWGLALTVLAFSPLVVLVLILGAGKKMNS